MLLWSEKGEWIRFMTMIALLSCCYLCSIFRIILYEILRVLMLWWVRSIGRSFERGRAVYYILWYGFTLGFILVSGFDLGVITLLVALIRFSKLPVFGLHQWLPKVHVEATILGSFFLAGIILKMGIWFCALYAAEFAIFSIGLTIATIIMCLRSDRKVIMAYSSVVHMTLCGFVMGWIGFMLRITHVLISPMIFMLVYVRYILSGSRLLSISVSRLTLIIVLFMNLGFPLLGAFMGEVYVVWMLGGIHFVRFALSFWLMGMIHVGIFLQIRGMSHSNFIGAFAVLLLIY